MVIVGATVVDVSVAVPVVPVTGEPPMLPVGVPVVLGRLPATVACTCTVMVQLAPAAMVPPARLTLLAPATAVTVPPQVLAPAGVALLTRPAG